MPVIFQLLSRRVTTDRIVDGGVDILIVRGRAPLDAAVDAAPADTRLPDELAFFIGIEAIDDARFLSHREQTLPVSEIYEIRRRAEIIVGPAVLGTIGTVSGPGDATAVPHVAAGDLVYPADRSGTGCQATRSAFKPT